ncbi:MAG: hypothetical protein ACJ71T_05995 [Actinomycetales bacterium]
MRRAARWDGVVPLFERARHGEVPSADDVRDLVGYVGRQRGPDAVGPFEVVLGGVTPPDPARARDVLGPLLDAGCTWWDERQLQWSEDLYRLSAVRRRVEAGPPAF